MVRTAIIKTTRVALAGLLLLPIGCLAAGLGKLTVLSGLGQPLRAEIEVVAVQRAEADTLAARIATPDAFREAGVDYGSVVPQVRAALQRRPDNRYVIALTTQQPVEEPFLDLLVELNWAAGRLVRQYTFLLDPAEYKGPQAITAPPKVAAPAVTPVEQPKPPTVTAEAPPAAAPAPAPAPPAPAQAGLVREPPGAAGTYEVKQGDTLGKIAAEHKIDGVTAQQMLVALYRANEDAFINKNMNLVRAGRVLTIPDRAAAEAVAASDANKIVLAQWQDFNEYRARLGQTVAAAPARAGPAPQRAAGRITAKADDAQAAPKPAPKDELRISKADAAKGAKAAAAARADDAAARERALREANERVSALEKNVQDMQKLLELKNQQFADLQRQAQAAKAAPKAPEVAKAPAPAKAEPPPAPKPEPVPAPVIAKAEPPKPEAPKAEPVKPEAPKPEAPKPEAVAAAPVVAPPPPDAPKAEAPKPEAPKAEAPKPEAPKPEAPKPIAKKPAPPPPPPEPSLVDMLLEEPLYLAGAGGGILALLIGGYLWRKKRSTKLENSLLGVTTTDSSSVFGTTGGRSVDTGGSSLQTDFSQSGIGAIDTDEVDPVAEADVYMAYGRDAQAEEILKEALQKDPNRQAVRVKLLEIYAARKDLKAFETTAGELYAASGGQGPEWAKAVELGQQVDPANPMYGGRAGASPAKSQPTVVLPAAAAAAAAAAPDIALDLSPKAPPAIDFDLDAGGRGAAAPDLSLDVASQAPTDLGFDLNLGGDTKEPAEEASDFSPSGTFIMDAATKKAVSDMVESQNEGGSLAIDFELPGTKPGGARTNFEDTARIMAKSQPTNVVDFDFKPEAPKGTSQGMDLSAISFDLGTPAAGGEGAPVNAGWQEVATKLDLAKAYQEMGDKEGARELLNEVLKEGDAAQQQQAKTMLAALR
jgi:pilus assembly protein FimV